ncbi:MAG: hypothetical protein L0Y56_00685 [Nitrospira sp.]|nr:hypothetical protein [Nitrospira sp.]
MQKMSQEEINVLLKNNLQKKIQEFLNQYRGQGKRILDGEGMVKRIELTGHQVREHDRQYRARLIQEGVLKSKTR